jgi:hypothetical protein
VLGDRLRESLLTIVGLDRREGPESLSMATLIVVSDMLENSSGIGPCWTRKKQGFREDSVGYEVWKLTENGGTPREDVCSAEIIPQAQRVFCDLDVYFINDVLHNFYAIGAFIMVPPPNVSRRVTPSISLANAHSLKSRRYLQTSPSGSSREPSDKAHMPCK